MTIFPRKPLNTLINRGEKTKIKSTQPHVFKPKQSPSTLIYIQIKTSFENDCPGIEYNENVVSSTVHLRKTPLYLMCGVPRWPHSPGHPQKPDEGNNKKLNRPVNRISTLSNRYQL